MEQLGRDCQQLQGQHASVVEQLQQLQQERRDWLEVGGGGANWGRQAAGRMRRGGGKDGRAREGCGRRERGQRDGGESRAWKRGEWGEGRGRGAALLPTMTHS